MISRILYFLSLAQFLFLYNFETRAVSGESSELKGSLSIRLEAGSPENPFFYVSSCSLKGEPIFRGQIKSSSGNVLTFYQVPDLLIPDNNATPFKEGMLATQKARGRAVLESNGTISSVTLDLPGKNYLTAPKVYIDLPTTGSDSSTNFRIASIEASIDSSSKEVSSLKVIDPGIGYASEPRVKIEGGIHFLRLAEIDSKHTGRFYKITGNTSTTVTLQNPLQHDLQTIFQDNQIVEIFEAWTLGSLFGYEVSELSIKEGNTNTADYVYLLNEENQNGNSSDFTAYFHDGKKWRTIDSNTSESERVIHPDQAFIIARRNPSPIEVILSGTANTDSTFAHLPAKTERHLLNNPYGVDLMLSNLIATTNLTTDSNDHNKWLANVSQEMADNVKILSGNVWNTYWHDGTNMMVVESAQATARYGTGVGGGITQQDISMRSGIISAMTNPSISQGYIRITSSNHGLFNGFVVKISGARGYKTNNSEAREEIDENGNLVSTGANRFEIDSGANGEFMVVNADFNSFELKGKSGDCNFIYDPSNPAIWFTGASGSGYTSDAYVSFIGGGGQGAQGIASVSNGMVTSILVTKPGAGYSTAPKVFIHSGGWRKLGSGNTPFNDVLVPAGSGILLVRNHPNGIRAKFKIDSPF